MSSGSSVFKLPSTPSINTKAPCPAPKVLIPRTQNSEKSLPGSPLRVTEMMPGTRPPNMLLMEVAGVFSVATSTPVMAPVTLIFFCTLPDAVITTSSITFELSFNTTRMRSLLLFIFIS